MNPLVITHLFPCRETITGRIHSLKGPVMMYRLFVFCAVFCAFPVCCVEAKETFRAMKADGEEIVLFFTIDSSANDSDTPYILKNLECIDPLINAKKRRVEKSSNGKSMKVRITSKKEAFVMESSASESSKIFFDELEETKKRHFGFKFEKNRDREEELPLYVNFIRESLVVGDDEMVEGRILSDLSIQISIVPKMVAK